MALADQIGRDFDCLFLLRLFTRTQIHECGHFQIRGASLDICELFLGDIDEVFVPRIDFAQAIFPKYLSSHQHRRRLMMLHVIAVR